MRLLILTILGLLIFNIVFGQIEFRKGYIIKNNGDTIKGMLQPNSIENNSRYCIFKRFDIARSFQYNPKEIKGYKFQDGPEYQSFTISDKPVFLEILVKGKVSLSGYGKNKKFYISSDKLGWTELSNQSVTINDQQTGANTKAKDYKELLHLVMSDSPSIQDQIDNSKLDLISLKKLVEDYNKSINSTFVSYNRIEGSNDGFINTSLFKTPNKKFGIIIGINQPSLGFTKGDGSNNKDFYLGASKFKGGGSIPLGIFYSSYFSRNYPKITYQVELIYEKINLSAFSETQNFYAYYVDRNDVYIHASFIKLPVLIKYSIPIKKVSPYITLGLMGIKPVAYDNYRNFEMEDIYSHEVSTQEFFPNKKKGFDTGFLGGIGIEFKISPVRSLFAEIRYDSQMSDFGGFERKGKLSGIKLQIGFNL
jgi:hypothetical protein